MKKRFMRRIRARRDKDAELEVALDIRKHDPMAERYGPVISRADIVELENERLPWRRAKG